MGGSQDGDKSILHVIGVVGHEYLWMIEKTGLLLRKYLLQSSLIALGC